MSVGSLAITETDTGIAFDVKVVPGASRDEIVGLLGDALKVRVAAPPEGGQANQAVCELLAEALRVGKRDVSVVGGQTKARKRIAVAGVDVATAQRRMEKARR